MVGKEARHHREGLGDDIEHPSTSAPAPGKRTLTDELAYASPEGHDAPAAMPLPRLELGSGPAAPVAGPAPLPTRVPGAPLPRLELGRSGSPATEKAASQARPTRVAEAEGKGKEPNAVIKVLVYSGGKLVKQWSAKARWEGPLPRVYTGERVGARWKWNDPDARSVRVGSDLQGRGGKSLETWAGGDAEKIVMHAQSLRNVTQDDEAEPDEHAPGHVDKEDAGDGSSNELKEADGATGGSKDDRGERAGRDGGNGDLTPSEKDEALADDFERSIGIDPDGADDIGDEATTGETSGGQKPGGEGKPGGDADGRTGDDTRVGGTGPGGDKARSDGQGKGSEDGGRGGTEKGSPDGKDGGDPDGMFGGEGKEGDGVPSAMALFGGLIGVPAALKGLVELALIISDANITGAGAGLFKQGLGKITSAVAARKMIARHSRIAAAKETKAAVKRLATDKRTAAAWKTASKAERDAVTRRIYWELQRKYFDAYQRAAKQAKREARAALKKAPKNVDAQKKLAAAEMADEAAEVKTVAGRLPQNHQYAGKGFPDDLLPAKYRGKGLRFTPQGYPDFGPYAKQLPNGKKHVRIEYTGSRERDFAAANAKAGLDETPFGWTWHHVEDARTMMLVPTDLHDAVKHTGGVSTYKHASGVDAYGS